MPRFNRSLLDFSLFRSILLGILWGAMRKISSPNRLFAGSAVVGLTGLSWLAVSSVAPPAAIAYTARASIPLVRQGEESFQTFLRRAEAIARAATQRSFDSDILVTEVSITIVGENNGAVLPVLILNVSRADWRNEPDPQRWAKYFSNAPLLLGFEPVPAPSPVTQPPASGAPEGQPPGSAEPTPTVPPPPTTVPSLEEPLPSPPPPPNTIQLPPPTPGVEPQ